MIIVDYLYLYLYSYSIKQLFYLRRTTFFKFSNEKRTMSYIRRNAIISKSTTTTTCTCLLLCHIRDFLLGRWWAGLYCWIHGASLLGIRNDFRRASNVQFVTKVRTFRTTRTYKKHTKVLLYSTSTSYSIVHHEVKFSSIDHRLLKSYILLR